MAYFTVRVELHDATSEKDYETLHIEMGKSGFGRTIQLDEASPIYHLPHAEYSIINENTAEAILELAKTAATKTNKKFSVLVTKSTERRQWFNLKPVNKV